MGKQLHDPTAQAWTLKCTIEISKPLYTESHDIATSMANMRGFMLTDLSLLTNLPQNQWRAHSTCISSRGTPLVSGKKKITYRVIRAAQKAKKRYVPHSILKTYRSWMSHSTKQWREQSRQLNTADA